MVTLNSDLDILAARGLLTANLLAVHAVGLTPPAIEQFRSSGAGLVWCPSSNVFMLGRTAPGELLKSGVDVLLGSDSLLTGSANLLDELRFARARAPLTDRDLEHAVGKTAAARLGLPAPALEPGSRADLILVTAPLLEARAADVELVMVGGVPRVASSQLAGSFSGFAAKARRKTVAGVTRWTVLSSLKTGNC